MIRRRRSVSVSFAGYRFPPDVILLAVRWYLRYGLSYRDVAELLGGRVDTGDLLEVENEMGDLVIEANAQLLQKADGGREEYESVQFQVQQ
jgi:hypothetical protein